ncbi:hypothetical protein FD755_024388, partial [Muntiacus reevesi]
MKSDMANLKDNNKALSQQLSIVKDKFNKLKIKLQRTRDDLREKTWMLECVQRDLNQAECQKQEIEHMYHNEQGKVNEYLGKQESLEKRLSQLQNQFQQIVRKLHAESEKQGLMPEERNSVNQRTESFTRENVRQAARCSPSSSCCSSATRPAGTRCAISSCSCCTHCVSWERASN